jgi:electron transport complex protein RnfB
LIKNIQPLAEKIDAILPQTQCRQCGFQGCKPYADAIANGEANINQCPPGGDAGIKALAEVTGRPYLPLNIDHGIHKLKALAVIDEAVCIGCTLCIKACPVDAILGANKHMHTIIAAECTGCELCIAPCPVDCIHMMPISSAAPDLFSPQQKLAADIARSRYEQRLMRLAREKQERAQKNALYKKNAKNNDTQISSNSQKLGQDSASTHDKKAAIAAAIARANALKIAGTK